MITRYYEQFYTVYTETFSKKKTASSKSIIVKKIRPISDKINKLFDIVSRLENALEKQDGEASFSDNLHQEVKRFFDDITASLESIGRKDSVTFVSIPGYDDVSIQSTFAQFFIARYSQSFENLYNMIKEEARNKIKEEAPKTVLTVLTELLETFNSFPLRYEPVNPDLYFSQDKHNPIFSSKGVLTADKNIKEVAEGLRNGEINSDDIPVSVYPSPKQHRHLYVKNNRTFTAFSRAGIFPPRLVPILPTTEEANRPVKLNAGGKRITEEGNDGLTTRRVKVK